MKLSTILLTLSIMLDLFQRFYRMVEAERQKGAGREEIKELVLERFEDAAIRANEARDAANLRIEHDGLYSDSRFRRD